MEPLAALGMASNIIQLVDFCSKLLKSGHELYTSEDGRLRNHVVISRATLNLQNLCRELQSQAQASDSTIDRQLDVLAVEVSEIAKALEVALEKVRIEAPDRNETKLARKLARQWKSITQALISVLNQNKVAALLSRLDNVRRQIDTALLVSLRKSIQIQGQFTSFDKDGHSPTFDDQARQRHAELLDAIRRQSCNISGDSALDTVSNMLLLATKFDVENRFCKTLLARLDYRLRRDRSEEIPKAYRNTFQWIFRSPSDSSDRVIWASLPDWLQNEHESLYWITGKPGAGKSTLMRFLSESERLASLAERWSGDVRLTQASFYFWNSGAQIQMSLYGLFRTLLHSCLSGDRELTLYTFPDRFEQYRLFGTGIESFSWPELRRAFQRMISHPDRNFLFLIDGLDEFEGSPGEVIQTVLEAAARPNVKICAASRPWLPFEDAFGRRPHLLLEQLTKSDILSYVTDRFGDNQHYRRLSRSDGTSARALILSIVDKASGVFLWVYLAVDSLLVGFSNADPIPILQERLDALPSDLEKLYEKLLYRLDAPYFKQACQVFRLLRAFRTMNRVPEALRKAYYAPNKPLGSVLKANPSLLELYFADSTDPHAGLATSFERLQLVDAYDKADDMKRRLNARCKGFLEVREPTRVEETPHFTEHQVCYLHRTGRDFVESEGYWQKVLQATGYDSFDADRRWANAFLLCHKQHPLARRNATRQENYMNYRYRCLEQALHLERTTGVVQATYLDAVFADVSLSDARRITRDFTGGSTEMDSYLSLRLGGKESYGVQETMEEARYGRELKPRSCWFTIFCCCVVLHERSKAKKEVAIITAE